MHFHKQLQSKWFMHAPNFETLIGNFEFKLQIFKFGVSTWCTKQITMFVRRKCQERSEKLYDYELPDWSFKGSILSFILNFEVSDQNFEVREARLNRFDCN